MAAIRALYEQQAPAELEATVESADRICGHVFDLLGSGPVALGTTIDWHRDFKSGYRWNPDQCFLDVAHGHEVGVDIKVPWELSRGHHLVLLAQTALLSGDEKYARECLAQMTSWIDANPTAHGVNWACPMDVAFRAVNWLWSLGLLAESPLMTEAWLTEVLASLVAHGRFLMSNLEVRDDGVTTNHYLADLVGLLYLGLCLKEVHDAEGWKAFAVRELVREMDRQVLADGAHYESSLSYHRLVTEMFLSSAMLCRRHGVELPPSFYDRLRKMCEFVQGYTKPNGLAPQIGDGDNGRLHILTGYGHADVRDHRHLLAVGAVLFDRPDWWAAAGLTWVEGCGSAVSAVPRGGRRRAPGLGAEREPGLSGGRALYCVGGPIMPCSIAIRLDRGESEPTSTMTCSRWRCTSGGKIFLWIRVVFSILPTRNPIIDFAAPSTTQPLGWIRRSRTVSFPGSSFVCTRIAGCIVSNGKSVDRWNRPRRTTMDMNGSPTR
ncbi:MAG: hypothetical protein IPM88_14885 [Nitrospira sp.]|nr:hypothetical protein [Nitrospira sp.]